MNGPREYTTEPGPLEDLPVPMWFSRTGRHMPNLKATGIEALVCADIARRQQLGIAKYGTTVADNPLQLRAWLQHAYEEHMDAAVYLRRAIAELDAQAASPSTPEA